MVKYAALIVAISAATLMGTVWVMADRASGPVVEITEPSTIGQVGQLVMSIDTPRGELTELEITLEQDEQSIQVFSLANSGLSALIREGENRLGYTQAIGKQQFDALREGSARVVVSATRPLLFGLRQATTVIDHPINVRLRPPVIAVNSRFHYINHGGSEAIVYRVSPDDVDSGVLVGEIEYPGFPAAGAGIRDADAGLRVAFFALMWNQDRNTPISLYARDAFGNESRAAFDYRIFPKQFRESRINLSDAFMSRVVPAILQSSIDFTVDDPSNILQSYVSINSRMRRENDAYIASLSARTSPEILWRGSFKQLINTAVESGFADQRDYVYEGEIVDHQTHLGFDLASTVNAPILAANRGRVVHAGWLGIYGNCVIIDHGMGLQSLYAHLSSIVVGVGDMVEMDQELGRSGSTGLAGGDHLHFTMLLNGNAVTPVDWWSSQWVDDRVIRKFVEAEQ